MRKTPSGFWSRVRERLFPRVPPFGALLAEQCSHVQKNAGDLVAYLEAVSPDALRQLDENEAEAERLRRRNMERLARAFSTTFDREDIRRAIAELDWITVHLNLVPHEMRALDLASDEALRKLGREVQRGTEALLEGFRALPDRLEDAARHAEAARDADRRARRVYEHALADLFAGSDPIEMMKRREVYHHLADGAKRVHTAASVLQDIIVKSG